MKKTLAISLVGLVAAFGPFLVGAKDVPVKRVVDAIQDSTAPKLPPEVVARGTLCQPSIRFTNLHPDMLSVKNILFYLRMLGIEDIKFTVKMHVRKPMLSPTMRSNIQNAVNGTMQSWPYFSNFTVIDSETMIFNVDVNVEDGQFEEAVTKILNTKITPTNPADGGPTTLVQIITDNTDTNLSQVFPFMTFTQGSAGKASN